MSDQLFHNIAKPLLDKTTALTIQLNELLEKEKTVLKSVDTSSLESIASEKELIMTTLDKHHQDWLALAEQQIKVLSTDRMHRFLKYYDEKNDTKLFEIWKSLQDQARKCQRLNTINGSIIILRNQAANQILSILRGQASENSIYDTHGNQTAVYNGGHSLAKA